MKHAFIILLHAFVGWAICGAIIGIGFSLTTEANTLIIHACAVPVVFGVIAWNYFHRFHYTSALMTACIFLIFIAGTDFFLVALIIQKSFVMFSSIIGTWIPFASIFLTTYLVGIFTKKSST
jgi:hypothetical protein